ncbi:LlaJI family restriction endonuclease [Anaerovibrio sp.]|uniref:LlaJI family restriction endonuclease n=1 Tax=Anaerovibrio sp. TaxID=1872532 RepID=UPI002609D0F0|nr:LlaJI family restriction endonuclease [Anaerovibrio sp.]MDD6596895.1 LlaJI family restriction endonuclease [Anaerovibrio sp.]
MISKYIKEQKRYTQDELRKIFECTPDKTVQILRKLKEYSIVKNVKKSNNQSMLSNLAEEDVSVTNIEIGERELYYIFCFVGIIVIYGRVLKCYPKYIYSCDNPIVQMKQILQVLEKYNSKEQIIKLYNESDDSGSFNLLAVMLYLLQDYYDNGIYNDDVAVIETNGTGEILWDRTINETFSYIYQIIGHIILNYRRKSESQMNIIL